MLISLNDLAHRHGVRPRTVVHAGAHLGEEAAGYAAIGVERVLWVEANPRLIAPLLAALGDAPPPTQHQVVCVAASSHAHSAVLHIASNGESSSLLPLGTHEHEHPEVTYVDEVPVIAAPLDGFVDGYGFGDAEMLNMDLQGYELEALQGATGLLGRPSLRWVYAEVNEDEVYEGCGQRPAVERLLGDFGFELVTDSMTRHGWGDALYERSAAWDQVES